jgi:hypothetical protein
MVVVAVVMVVCVAAVVYGARWISWHADAELEKTKRVLKARYAVPDPVSLPGPAADGDNGGRTPTVAHLGVPVGAGRHQVLEELLRAATYRLSGDRVARARVPQPPVRARRGENRRRLPCRPAADATNQRVNVDPGLVRDAPTGAARRR